MVKHQVLQFLVFSIAIGISRDVHGASLDVVSDGESTGIADHKPVTLQDFKNYIQPIIYQKLLRTPGDTPVVQQAKAVVSEYLSDSLVESIQNPPSFQQLQTQQRPTQKQANNTGSTITSTIIQAVGGSNRNRTRPSQQHVFNQVDNIIQNVNGANITGIVDQALLIRAPAPVRQLVNGILNSVLCNPFNRLWNRCAGGGSLLFGGTRR